MEMKIFLILFFFLYYSICDENLNIYTPEEVLNILNGQVITEEDLKYIKNNISSVFEDVYAYFETSKNPPQPDFDKNYHKIVDIKDEINKITSRTKYSLFQDFLKLSAKLRDGHINIGFNDYYQKYNLLLFGILPFQLIIEIDSNGKPIMYCIKIEIKEEARVHFKNHETIFEIIKNNSNNPVKLINGQDPFEFISNFGSEYQNFRNIHASFTQKLHLFNIPLFLMKNLSIEELTNITNYFL